LNGRYICVDKISRKALLPSDVLVDDSFIPIGNPDLTLIRSDEIGFLVRLLFLLSEKFNSKVNYFKITDTHLINIMHLYQLQCKRLFSSSAIESHVSTSQRDGQDESLEQFWRSL